MRTQRLIRTILLAALSVLMLAPSTFAHESSARGHANLGLGAAKEMSTAASRFLASLDAEQTKVAHIKFDEDERKKFFFVPDKFTPDKKRYGLVISKLKPQQRLLLDALLATGLSSKGIAHTKTTMALEQVLHEMENNNPIRNPELYYVTIFGDPKSGTTWGWKFEGHHLSINYTIVDSKKFAVTPSFFGSNPGKITEGALAGTELQADEGKLAKQFLESLTEEERAAAKISEQAPRDIITGQDRKVKADAFSPAKGIAYEKLTKVQQRKLTRLVRVFTTKYRSPIVHQIEHRTPVVDAKTVHFAWAGSMEDGKGFYYRVQSKTFLFEYDNTQNGANHPHAVWRSFDGDFGEDLLAEHYLKDHKKD